MQSTIEAALTQHARNLTLFRKKAAGKAKITFEVQRRHDGSCHNFGITHLALLIFKMMKPFQHVFAETKNDYNLGIHESLLYFESGNPNLLETHGFLLKFTSR
jgi:hypothetical protein